MWNKLFGVSLGDLSLVLSSTKPIHLWLEMHVPGHALHGAVFIFHIYKYSSGKFPCKCH